MERVAEELRNYSYVNNVGLSEAEISEIADLLSINEDDAAKILIFYNSMRRFHMNNMIVLLHY